MPKTRSLTDLYIRGKELVLDDGQGEVTVWLQKLNPVEYAKAARRSDTARSKILVALRDQEGEEYSALLGDVLALERDEKLNVVVGAERRRITPMVEEEIALSDEWNEGYLQGLRDSWNDGVMKQFIDDPEDKEAKRVHDALVKYMDEASAKVQRDLDDYRAGMEMLPAKDLDDAVLRLHMKNMGDVAWLDEFKRCELWLAVRDREDHSRPLFATRADVDLIQVETLNAVSEALRELTVDPVEGKDSAGIPPSSASSEPSDKEETVPSSGPEEVPA